MRRAMTEAGVESEHYIPSLSGHELEALVTGASFVAYEGELRTFVNFYQDVDALLAWSSSSSFGNFLANVAEARSARMRDVLARLLEPKRRTSEGICLERHLLFATARKPAN